MFSFLKRKESSNKDKKFELMKYGNHEDVESRKSIMQLFLQKRSDVTYQRDRLIKEIMKINDTEKLKVIEYF